MSAVTEMGAVLGVAVVCAAVGIARASCAPRRHVMCR